MRIVPLGPLGSLLVIAACGSKPPPAPPPVPVKPPPPKPAPVSCGDAAAILRGDVEEDSESDAGPARERAIVELCTRDRWPREVLDCVGTKRKPAECIELLAEPQGEAYQRLAIVTPPPAPAQVSCDDAVHDEALYPPALEANAPERTWVIKLRRAWLVDDCKRGWSDDAKACLLPAPDPESCSAQLDRGTIEQKLATFDELAARVEKARKQPHTCKRVVAAHYADARWKQQLAGEKPAERRRLIAASRERMTKACTSEQWDDTLRACVVVGGGETCFESYGMALRWGYPALGVGST